MLHACNPKGQEAEAGRLQQVPCQLDPHSKFEARHRDPVSKEPQNKMNKKQLASATRDQHLTQPVHRRLGFAIFNEPSAPPPSETFATDRKLLPSAVTPTFCLLSAPGDLWSIFCPCGLAYSGHFIEMKSHDTWRLCLASPPLHGFCTVRATVSQASSACFPGASITGMWGYHAHQQHACMWRNCVGVDAHACVCTCGGRGLPPQELPTLFL